MRGLAVLGLAALLAGAPAADAKPASTPAVRVATAHVSSRHGIGGLRDIVSLQSRVDPRWALVDGYYSRPRRSTGPGPWAVWLFRTSAGWTVRWSGIDGRAFRPPARLKVPCDIQPAFSQPYC